MFDISPRTSKWRINFKLSKTQTISEYRHHMVLYWLTGLVHNWCLQKFLFQVLLTCFISSPTQWEHQPSSISFFPRSAVSQEQSLNFLFLSYHVPSSYPCSTGKNSVSSHSGQKLLSDLLHFFFFLTYFPLYGKFLLLGFCWIVLPLISIEGVLMVKAFGFHVFLYSVQPLLFRKAMGSISSWMQWRAVFAAEFSAFLVTCPYQLRRLPYNFCHSHLFSYMIIFYVINPREM